MNQFDPQEQLEFAPGALRLTQLRRYVFGELDPAAAAEIETAIAQDPTAQARVDALRSEQVAFTENQNVAVLSAQVVAQAETHKPRRGWLLGGALATMIAAAGAMALVMMPSTPGNDGIRTKGGGPGLELFVKDAQGVRRAETGIHLAEGDQIQLKYAASGLQHLMVVSVDGQGVVSPLYPADPGSSLAVDPQGVHVLQGSVILDDAKGPEHIIGLFSDNPLTYDEVLQAAQDALRRQREAEHLPDLALPRDDVVEARVMIIKE